MTIQNNIQLTEEQHEAFEKDGYLVFPGFLDETTIQELKDSVDEKIRIEQDPDLERKHVVEYGSLGMLTSHPQLMLILDQLFGDKNYTMHHIHAVRQDAGNKGVTWHHDYEQIPQVNRNYLMVHAFFYLNGLNGEIGDLLALPGSHKMVCERDLGIFGTEELPGSLAFDNLEAGSMVIVHSALFHGRRQKPGGENSPRYFIDTSYCEKGIKWPRYGHAEAVREVAFKTNMHRNGEYDYLYDPSEFYERGAIREKLDQVDDEIKHLFKNEKE